MWNVAVGDVKQAYSITMAPLIVKDKVIIGVGGGEFGIRGFVAAYDVEDRQGGVALLHDSRSRRAGTATRGPATRGRTAGRRSG